MRARALLPLVCVLVTGCGPVVAVAVVGGASAAGIGAGGGGGGRGGGGTTGAPVAELAFEITQPPPPTVIAGQPFEVRVVLRNGDAGALAAQSVFLGLTSESGQSFSLSGPTSQKLSNVMTFSGIKATVPAKSLRLLATGPGIGTGTSPPFDVVPGP